MAPVEDAVDVVEPAVYLPKGSTAKANRAKVLKAQIAADTAELDALDDHFRKLLEASDVKVGAAGNRVIVSLIPGGRRQLDTKRLRAERPAVADAYTGFISWETVTYA
jgi:hypothetical protein